jgi:putative addiction module component (TIGR02574 family)
MNPDIDRLLKDALQLPPEARGALAGRLIDSLDTEVDPDVEAAWDAEITRREQEIESGRVKPLSWAEARREILRAP